MSYLNTLGKAKFSIAICGRCSTKIPYVDLVRDGDIPGLLVCSACADEPDPWRLPPRQAEDISLQNPRPDASIADDPRGLITNPYQEDILVDEDGDILTP